MQGKFTIVHKILSVFQPFPPEFFPSSGKTSLFPQKFPLAAVFPVPRLPAGTGTPKGPFPAPDCGDRAPLGWSSTGGTLSWPGVSGGKTGRQTGASSRFPFSGYPTRKPRARRRGPLPLGADQALRTGGRGPRDPLPPGKIPRFGEASSIAARYPPFFARFPAKAGKKFFRSQKAGRPTGVPLFHVFPSEFPVFPLKAPPAGPGAAAPPRARPPAAEPDRGRAPSPGSKRNPAPSCS